MFYLFHLYNLGRVSVCFMISKNLILDHYGHDMFLLTNCFLKNDAEQYLLQLTLFMKEKKTVYVIGIVPSIPRQS